MTPDFRIYTAPIVTPDGDNWIAVLGDVEARGRTELEARDKLRARLAELERQLRGIGWSHRPIRRGAPSWSAALPERRA